MRSEGVALVAASPLLFAAPPPVLAMPVTHSKEERSALLEHLDERIAAWEKALLTAKALREELANRVMDELGLEEGEAIALAKDPPQPKPPPPLLKPPGSRKKTPPRRGRGRSSPSRLRSAVGKARPRKASAVGQPPDPNPAEPAGYWETAHASLKEGKFDRFLKTIYTRSGASLRHVQAFAQANGSATKETTISGSIVGKLVSGLSGVSGIYFGRLISTALTRHLLTCGDNDCARLDIIPFTNHSGRAECLVSKEGLAAIKETAGVLASANFKHKPPQPKEIQYGYMNFLAALGITASLDTGSPLVDSRTVDEAVLGGQIEEQFRADMLRSLATAATHLAQAFLPKAEDPGAACTAFVEIVRSFKEKSTRQRKPAASYEAVDSNAANKLARILNKI